MPLGTFTSDRVITFRSDLITMLTTEFQSENDNFPVTAREWILLNSDSDLGLDMSPSFEDSTCPEATSHINNSSEDGPDSMPKPSGPRTPRKNAIRKGQGVDAKPDRFDRYPYHLGYFHRILGREFGTWPKAPEVFAICAKIESKVSSVSLRNRWAKRRLPNAYAWLDHNQALVSDEAFCSVVREVMAGWKRDASHYVTVCHDLDEDDHSPRASHAGLSDLPGVRVH
jgi:hypothetical protein